MGREQGATLGQEISRLRGLAGFTLRGFAERIKVSAAYLSDIERDRRRPSEDVLRRMADELANVGATYEGLDALSTRLERDLQHWLDTTPAVRQMLREVKSSGKDPREILKRLQEDAKKGGGSQ
ncbi:MAG TPA: helix-turn-helix transcriptional regulator [Vicinamibacterales bacterium]|nr:helix-turn-helix transcriptional regulator [Vicinamibacterales bacterium]